MFARRIGLRLQPSNYAKWLTEPCLFQGVALQKRVRDGKQLLLTHGETWKRESERERESPNAVMQSFWLIEL